MKKTLCWTVLALQIPNQVYLTEMTDVIGTNLHTLNLGG